MWHFAWQNLVSRPLRTILAVVGLTIPIVAILGLFSLTHGIRSLMGNTLASMNGLMVMRVGRRPRSSASCRRDSPRRSAGSRGSAWWRRRSGGSPRPWRAATSWPARR